VSAQKPAAAKADYIVRTDAVVVAGKHYHYGSKVKLDAATAKPLLAVGKVEKA